MSINQVYKFYTIGRPSNSNYSYWDGEQTTMCVCHPGYTGPDCEMGKPPTLQNIHVNHSFVYMIYLTDLLFVPNVGLQ